MLWGPITAQAPAMSVLPMPASSQQPKPLATVPPLYAGLSAVSDHYDAFILDIWGVLHDGIEAYPQAASTLLRLQEAGKQVVLLSNSPSRAARVSERTLAPMGLPRHLYTDIMTSGEAAHALMARDWHGARIYCVWPEEQPSALEGLVFDRVYDVAEADVMFGALVPYDATLTDYMPVLQQACEKGLPFVCGNPDRVVGHGSQLHLCIGSLAEYYEGLGGRVIWVGKPYIPVYKLAHEMIGRPDKRKICAVGDSLVTDVQGAHAFGCDVLWNMVGIHWDEVRDLAHPSRLSAPRLLEAIGVGPVPTGLLHGFAW